MNQEKPPKNMVELTKASLKEYIELCDGLMDYSFFDDQEKSNWVGNPHGIHIRFQHKKTSQVVEVPFAKIKKRKDFNTFLWLEFVRSTPKFKPVEDFFNQRKGLEEDFVNDFLDKEFFENREVIIPEFKTGDFIQLRDSVFEEDFNSRAYWDLKYYYEDQIQHIYWPLERNFERYGCNVPTILGGIKSRIKEVVMDNSGISKIYTDLFIVDMPYAYEKNQFQPVGTIDDYKVDEWVDFLINQLSFYEYNCMLGLFTPSERENNKIHCTQQYFERIGERFWQF
ncbi:hypothetical protein AAG747_12830 [Rapidithrix thailandica]|uniref:Uncharacterized protein n=1 Tax=Rapidithrix thailandica TaxID=413964 RepID=A0AAW9S4J7_9BACT